MLQPYLKCYSHLFGDRSGIDHCLNCSDKKHFPCFLKSNKRLGSSVNVSYFLHMCNYYQNSFKSDPNQNVIYRLHFHCILKSNKKLGGSVSLYLPGIFCQSYLPLIRLLPLFA